MGRSPTAVSPEVPIKSETRHSPTRTSLMRNPSMNRRVSFMQYWCKNVRRTYRHLHMFRTKARLALCCARLEERRGSRQTLTVYSPKHHEFRASNRAKETTHSQRRPDLSSKEVGATKSLNVSLESASL